MVLCLMGLKGLLGRPVLVEAAPDSLEGHVRERHLGQVFGGITHKR